MKQCLFLTYYFPPSGGPGVQRALKFAKYLPENGWQPTVITVDPAHAAYPNLDASLEDEVPSALPVERTYAWDPYALYARMLGTTKDDAVEVNFTSPDAESWKKRLARWVRANLFIPDARVGWVPFAVRRARTVLADTPHDAIVTSGPPHSTHLAGWWLHRRTGLPWIADFRDPWTDMHYYEQFPHMAAAARLDASLERGVLRAASRVVVVSPSTRAVLEPKVPGVPPHHFELIQNGFDPADFPEEEGDIGEPAGDAFVIGYVGTLSGPQNPTGLWQALRQLDATRTMPELRVRLVGNIDYSVRQEAEAEGVAGLVETGPYVPHRDAVRAMRRSSLLLIVVNRVAVAKNIVPGKLYEYLASGRPVLGIGPADADMGAVLHEAEAGDLFDYEDVAGIAAFVRAHYDAWKAGTPKRGAEGERLAPYSRRRQTAQLATLLNTVTEEAHG